MKSNLNSRRSFIKKTAASSAFVATAGMLPQLSAKSYARILGANDRINVSMMGVNSRGNALAQNFASQKNAEVIHVCDVDSRAVLKCLSSVQDRQSRKPKSSGRRGIQFLPRGTFPR